MRAAVWGSIVFIVGLSLVITASVQDTNVFAQNTNSTSFQPVSDQLIALSLPNAGQGPNQVVVVDPKKRVMSVYHIEPSTGEIALKSVRNVNWDLMMEEFNGVPPKVREIRSLLERR